MIHGIAIMAGALVAAIIWGLIDLRRFNRDLGHIEPKKPWPRHDG